MRIARMDWRRLSRERGPRAVLSVLTALLSLAAGMGLVRVRGIDRDFVQIAARERTMRAEIARQSDAVTDGGVTWGPHNPDFIANDRGTLAVANRPPLAVLSVGQTQVFASQVKVTAAGYAAGTASADLAHPLSQVLGAFDVEFVVVFLWPLAIIALTANMVASERERGTLPLLLSQPVPPLPLLAGWSLSRGTALLLPVVAVPWVAALVAGQTSVTALAIWSMVALAYGCWWIALSLLVAARGRSAPATSMWLAGLWLVVALVIPGTVHLLAAVAVDAPSEVAFADASRTATRDALTDGSRVLGHFLEDHPTAAAVGRDGLRQYALLQAARDQEVRRRLAPVLQDFERAIGRQRRIVAAAMPLSPVMVASQQFEEASGTSSAHGREFLRQVDEFRSEWQAYFAPRILQGAPLTAADAVTLPTFEHRPGPLLGTVKRISGGVSWLLVLAVGFSWLAARSIARHPLGIQRS